MKKNISIILLVLGIGIILYGSHMAYEAAQKAQGLTQAEQNVQDGRRPVLGPIRRGVNTQATENAQQKIGAAEQEVAKAQVTAYWVRSMGIALLIIGAAGLIWSCCCRKKRK